MHRVSDRAGASVNRPLASAIDLFCGAGGLTYGLQAAGLRVAAGIDIDSDCQFAFEANNRTRFINADVAEISPEDISRRFPARGFRVLAGCAPCQPFSRYARANRSPDYRRWGLLKHFLRLSASLKPSVITMENVPEMKHDPIFSTFVTDLRSYGYRVSYSNVFCPDYGVPQQRTRLVLFASLHGYISIPPPAYSKDNYLTVRHAIADLPRLKAGGVNQSDPLHRASRLTEVNLERIRRSKPGGCWRDWPQRLVSKCHRSHSGKTYPSVYGRMEWDAPSPTVTTQFFGYGNGRFGHPSQHRALSLREGALLQTFPKHYDFTPPSTQFSFVKLGQMIGNAVPVRLGEVIGAAICAHLEALAR